MAWSGGSSPRPQGFIDPCIPTLAIKPPAGRQWIHEIKHDGYRLIASRHRGRVHLFTRRGYDWSDRYPLIGETMTGLAQDATIDGEAVVCNAAGVADFERLHSQEHDRHVFLYAFNLLELEGLDLRPFPLARRKDQLQ
jgi:ATP-dependent DNA ligase